MFSTNKFNLYILTSLTAHIICASFLLLQKGSFQQVNSDITEMVNIVIHQSSTPFTSPHRPEKVKPQPVIENADKNAIATEEKTVATSTASAQTSDGGQIGRLAKTTEEIYIAELKYDLEKRKKYPVMAKKMGHTGRVTIKFVIDRKGEIIQSEILEPSQHVSLNDSVKKLLSETKNFKPLPEEIQRATWQFILPVEFKL